MKTCRRLTLIPLLNPNAVDQDIRVKVLRKWFVPIEPGVGSRMHLLLRDVKGNRCEAVVEAYQIPDFDPLMFVGSVVTISGFSVVEYNNIYPPSEIPFMLMFHGDTGVVVTSDDMFSSFIYEDTDFMEIKYGMYNMELSVFDVFGAVVDYLELPMGDDDSGRMLVLVQDLHENLIRVVMKDAYYLQFKSYAQHIWRRKRTFFIILHLFRSVLWNGDVVLQSCKFMSDLITDQKHPEIVRYKSRLTRNISVSRSPGIRVLAYGVDVVEEEFFSPNVRVISMSDLFTSELCGKYLVIGKIQQVFRDTNWYNTKCLRCKTKVLDSYSRIYCHVCRTYIVPNALYRIRANVVSGLYSAEFLMLDDTAREITGRPVDELIDEILRDGDEYGERDVESFECRDLEFPEEIHRAIGNEYLFKIDIGPGQLSGGSKKVFKVKMVLRCSHELKLRLSNLSTGRERRDSNCSRKRSFTVFGEQSTSVTPSE